MLIQIRNANYVRVSVIYNEIDRVTLSFFPFSSLRESMELNKSNFRLNIRTKEERWKRNLSRKKIFRFSPCSRLRFEKPNKNCINFNSIFRHKVFRSFFFFFYDSNATMMMHVMCMVNCRYLHAYIHTAFTFSLWTLL